MGCGISTAARHSTTAADSAQVKHAVQEPLTATHFRSTVLPAVLDVLTAAYCRPLAQYGWTDGHAVADTGGDTPAAAAPGDASSDSAHGASLLYGEILPTSLVTLLDDHHLAASRASSFFDLGSGTGKCVLLAFLLFPHLRSCVGVELEPGRFAVAAGAAARLAALFTEHLAIVERTDDRIAIETIDSEPEDKSIRAATTRATGSVDAAAADCESHAHHDDPGCIAIELRLREASESAPTPTSTATSPAPLTMLPLASLVSGGSDSEPASAIAATSAPVVRDVAREAASRLPTDSAHDLPAPTPRSVCAAAGVVPPALTANEKTRCAAACAAVAAHAFMLQPTQSAFLSGANTRNAAAEHGSSVTQAGSLRPMMVVRRLVLLRGNMWTAAQGELLRAGAMAQAVHAESTPTHAPPPAAASASVPTTVSTGATDSAGELPSGYKALPATPSQPLLPPQLPLAVLLHTELPDGVRFQKDSPLYTLIASLPSASRFATYHDVAADWRRAVPNGNLASSAGGANGSGVALASTGSAAATAHPSVVPASSAPLPLPTACFAQLPQNVAPADVVYTSWAPRGGWHLFCWERL